MSWLNDSNLSSARGSAGSGRPGIEALLRLHSHSLLGSSPPTINVNQPKGVSQVLVDAIEGSKRIMGGGIFAGDRNPSQTLASLARGGSVGLSPPLLSISPPLTLSHHSHLLGDPPVSLPRTSAPDLPTRLHSILSNPDYEHIISWQPHGYAWKIKDLAAFVDRVITDYGHYPVNLNTFMRLLKLWGFRQITKGTDAGAYYHELFLRGVPELHGLMRPGQADRVLHLPDAEPDFYRLRPLPAGPLAPRSHSSQLLQALLANRAQDQARYQIISEALSLLSTSPPLPTTIAPSLPPASPPRLVASSMSTMLAAQELRDESIHHLLEAKRVADSGSTSKMATSPSGRKKRPRRKWLPPLGPSTSSLPKSSNCDWFFTNPEVFASLSESSPPK